MLNYWEKLLRFSICGWRFVYIYIYIRWQYIYIYIVIFRQTFSLYHNSSVWLETPDTASWARNLPNFTLDLVYSAQPGHYNALFISFCLFTFCAIGYWSAPFVRRALHYAGGAVNSFARVLNPREGSTYIVIQRQTVSLYNNTSVWLDTGDSSSWDTDFLYFIIQRRDIAEVLFHMILRCKVGNFCNDWGRWRCLDSIRHIHLLSTDAFITIKGNRKILSVLPSPSHQLNKNQLVNNDWE